MFSKLFRKIKMMNDDYTAKNFVPQYEMPEFKSNKGKSQTCTTGRNDVRIKQPKGKESRGRYERI